MNRRKYKVEHLKFKVKTISEAMNGIFPTIVFDKQEPKYVILNIEDWKKLVKAIGGSDE